jgi:hypothetical protein
MLTYEFTIERGNAMNTIKKGSSRREFVQGITTGAMGAAAAGYMGGANLTAAQSRTTGQAGTEKITVVNPLGTPPPVTLKAQAPRLDTLDGKTIYMVNYGYPNSDNVLYEMVDWFKANYPKTTFEYRAKPGGMNGREDPALWEEMRQKADAMILGIGH